MSIQDPSPEQVAAFQRLNSKGMTRDHGHPDEDWVAILPFISGALTNPKPVMPNKPGRYESNSGDSAWLLDAKGTWSYDGREDGPASEPEQYAPFTLLVPERPEITKDQIRSIVGAGTLLHSEMAQLYNLVNGKPND